MKSDAEGCERGGSMRGSSAGSRLVGRAPASTITRRDTIRTIYCTLFSARSVLSPLARARRMHHAQLLQTRARDAISNQGRFPTSMPRVVASPSAPISLTKPRRSGTTAPPATPAGLAHTKNKSPRRPPPPTARTEHAHTPTLYEGPRTHTHHTAAISKTKKIPVRISARRAAWRSVGRARR